MSLPDAAPAARPDAPMREGFLVSHSHWDRAWYLSFQAFRHRLVRMVDRLLDLLDRDARFRAFALDGQTVLVEDYLEIRSEREADLRRHIAHGRLLVGPWYVSPDLFLVSGEALVRNLRRGLRMAEHLGAVMPVGYVPDPFGHPAQMPQLLRGFGIDTYVFMRGMDAETHARCGDVFDWVAPDGSAVLALYQRDGYFNAAALGHGHVFGRFDGAEPSPETAAAQLRATRDVLAAGQPEGPLLLSNGMDHMPEQPALPDLLETLAPLLPDLALRHATLPEFLAALRKAVPERERYAGDLLGQVHHPVLQSVASTRLYLKQQNHRAQSLLTHVAEPLAALARLRGLAPDARPFLDHAWRELLRNHPHDDICGCSVDAVHRDDETRFRHVEEIADTLCAEVLEGLVMRGLEPPAATGARASDVFVFNPHPWPQRVRVRASVLFPSPGGEEGPPPPPEPLRACDAAGAPVPVTVHATEAPVMRAAFLEQTWGRRYDLSLETDVPALGYAVVHVFSALGEAGDEVLPASKDEIDAVLENTHYRLRVTAQGFALEVPALGLRFPDLPRFVYDRDAGDTYSFSPVSGDVPRFARCTDAGPHPTDPACLVAHYALDVPAGLDAAETVPLRLTVEARLEPTGGVGFRVRYRNVARNGRLRALLPTGLDADRALAGALWGLAERRRPETLAPEDVPERYAAYPGELPYPTQHHEDLVLIEGAQHAAWLSDRGLPEYELVDVPGGTALALTLHRAVGMLSVRGGRIRRCGAGPEIPTPEAQCLRDMEAAFALGFEPTRGKAEAARARAVRQAKAFAHPAWAREMPVLPHAPPQGDQPREASLLALSDPAVWLLSLRPEDDGPGFVVRLLNPSPEPRTARLHFGSTWPREAWDVCPADLRERWDDAKAWTLAKDGGLETTLVPHRAETVLLRPSRA